MKLTRKYKFIMYSILVLFSLYFLFPFIWALITALKTEGEVFSFPPKFIPDVPLFSNFMDAWNSQPFGIYFKNSMIVTVLTTIGQLISCSLVAYGFARYDFKYKNFLFILLLSTMMIPWM